MTAIVVPNFPLDLTSTDPRNRITNERHTFVKDTDRIFVPSAGPFYVSSFVIRNATTGVILKPTIDYKLLHPDIDAIHESGLHVCCVVFVVNTAVSSISIDYQVIGGQYSDLIPVVRELLANTDTIQPTINWYTQVYAKPDSYPPAPHWHTGNDFSEWDRIALRLDEIMSALVYKDRYSWQSAYDYVDRIVKFASDALRVELDMTEQFNNVYSKTQATELFLSKVDAATIYLSKTDATATYLSKADASSAYLTKANAATTYATRDGLTSVSNSLTTLINNVATDLNQNYIKKTDADTVNGLISATNSTILSMINERTKVSPDSGNALVKRVNGFYVPVSAQPDLSPYVTKSELSLYAKKTEVSAAISDYTYDKDTIDDKIGNVTIDIAELLKDPRFQQYKVGDILTTTRNYANGAAVAAAIGYGVWTKFAAGQTLLGVGTYTDKNGATRSISMMQQLGEYEHQLTIGEMPSHKHDMGEHFGGNLNLSSLASTTNNDERRGIDTNNPSAMLNPTGSSGGGQSHNNIQPSVGVGRWLRLPDDYTPPSFDIYFTTDAQGLNRVGQINEDSAIYLWIDVTNASMPIAVTKFNQQAAGEFISDGANLTYPPTINNGKNLMVSVLPKNYHVDMQSIIDWGFNLFDATVGEVRTIHTGLTINNTINDPPPYYGLKFEIRVVNDRGRPRCIPKVLENNSPFIVEATDPFTELEGGIKVFNIPTHLNNAFIFFTVEQNPVDGISNFKFGRYDPKIGDMHATVFSYKGIEDFRNGLIPDGTLLNTVKLTYTP